MISPKPVAATLLLAMLAAGAWAIAHIGLAASVPIHFDLNGTPDKYAPAWFGLFILPAMAGALWWLPWLLPRIDPRGANLQRSSRAIGTILLAATAIFAATQAMIICATIGVRVNTTHLVGVAVGLMFIVMGNVFGKLRWNYTVGIRTPWTIADERVWDQTHRFGGRLFVAGGVALAAVSLLFPPLLMMPATFAIIAVVVILPMVKSYTLWRGTRSQ